MSDIGEFQSGGHDVVCTQCRGTRFQRRKIILNTRGLAFFDMEWLNKGAMALTCEECGLIQLFARVPEVDESTT